MNLDFNLNFNFGKSSDLFNFDFQDIKIETEPPELEIPKQENQENTEVKLPEPKPEIEDTFVVQTPTAATNSKPEESNGDPWLNNESVSIATEAPGQVNSNVFQYKPNDTNNSIFTPGSTIDWSKVTWETSDISVEAFKFDTSYSDKFINNDAELKVAFSTDQKFTDLFKADKFTGYVIDDGKWSYSELKDFEKKLTELNTKGQLTAEQQKGLESLKKETTQIEAQAERFAESGFNIELDGIIDLRLKNGGEQFYTNLTKLSETVKQQEARNSAAEISSRNLFAKDYVLKKNDTETRFNELTNKLEKNDYTSREAKLKDYEEFWKLYGELKEAQGENFNGDGAIDRIISTENVKKVIAGYDQDLQNFIKRHEELKEREKKGEALSKEERDTLEKMNKQRDTIVRLHEQLKNNPEKALEHWKNLMKAYAEVGNYEKAAEISDGNLNAADRATILERTAETKEEKEATRDYTVMVITDPILRKNNKLTSKDIDNIIKLNGNFNIFEQKYQLNSDISNSLKNEMRSLYTSDSEYNRYYSSDSASSRYYNNGGNGNYSDSSVAQYTREERNLLTETDRLIADGGTLLTTAAENEAIRGIMKDKGVSREIAEAIYFGKDEILNRIAQNRPEEGISYLKAASLSSRSDFNDNNIYNTLGISIS